MWSLLLTISAFAGPEWRAALGGEIGANGFGIADVGVRDGALSVELLTDTLDLRFQPDHDRGRSWLGIRTQAGAGGMLISPWTDGAPDPGRAQLAFVFGTEGGAVRYLPGGLWVGGQGIARYWHFARLPATEGDPMVPRPVLTPDLLAGIYRDGWLDAWVRAGIDWWPGTVSPHVQGRLALEVDDWTVSPGVLLHAGWADQQDDITRTRLGGMTPYVVPLGGAAWAEWWVEDYAAAQVGPVFQTEQLDVRTVVDLAWFDGETALGAQVRARGTWDRRFAEVSVGYAPWIDRPTNAGRTSVFFLLGVDWGRGFRRPDPAPN